MSTHLSRLRWALLGSCAVVLTFATATEAANRTDADLHVVDSRGKVLAEHRQYTGPTKVKTSEKADCFGQGTGGSGAKVKVPGSTALGLLQHAKTAQPKLRPLRLTDFFDFGLGVCGIGGRNAPATGYWYLKLNHVGSQAGGDQTTVKPGDDVLWHLITDFDAPIPAELMIKAPAKAMKGETVTVKVFEYSDNGTRTRAEGASLRGYTGATGADGKIEIKAGGGIEKLRAERDGAIASNALEVCSIRRQSDCPRSHVTRIEGSNRPDKIETTKGPDTVSALGGNDVVDIRASRNSAPPRVQCGVGNDKLIVRPGQIYSARKSCEKVVERRAS